MTEAEGVNPNLARNAVRLIKSSHKHTPARKCIVCNIRLPKPELIRIVTDGNNTPVLDRTGKIQGRGAYICRTATCEKSNLSKKRIEYSLRTDMTDDRWAKLVTDLSTLYKPS